MEPLLRGPTRDCLCEEAVRHKPQLPTEPFSLTEEGNRQVLLALTLRYLNLLVQAGVFRHPPQLT